MAALIVILVVFTGVMLWISTNGKQTLQNETFTTSEAAAEGATEMAFSAMDRDYLYGSLNSASNYDLLIPSMTNWPVQYKFNLSVTEDNQSSMEQPLGSQYQNLEGFPQTNIVTATATPIGRFFNIPATVSQTFVFASVPAFQFAIFYNINLEIDPGGDMNIQGNVFSNAGIWSGASGVTYASDVEAVGQVNISGNDSFCSGKSDNGTPRGNFYLSGMPVSDVNPLIIPIGAASSTNNNATNVEAIINIPPSTVSAPQTVAYEQTNQVYDFNAASLIVSNSATGTNSAGPLGSSYSVYLQDSSTAPYYVSSNGVSMNWLRLTNDFYLFTNYYGASKTVYSTNYVSNFNFTNPAAAQWVGNPSGTNIVFYAGFSFLTNVSFYDFREKATVQAVQIDVGKLNAWINTNYANGGSNVNEELGGDLGHGINSIFVYNGVPFIGQKQLPAVRIVNGQELPVSTNYNVSVNGASVPQIITCGLTVVTPQPLYVKGNYNVQIPGHTPLTGSHDTAYTYPAAFLADSITVLSSNWSDSYSSGTSLSSRPAANTTINAACLEGIVPSSNGNYSGGVENFLRLLEGWSGKTLTYNGSIMVMFPSLYATNIWPGTASVYSVPTRDWAFDTNFEVQADLPPLTPQFRTVIRNQWAGY